MECWYCHKIHPGGYRNCWRRARENPQCELQQSQQRQVGRGAECPRTAVVQACTYSSTCKIDESKGDTWLVRLAE